MISFLIMVASMAACLAMGAFLEWYLLSANLLLALLLPATVIAIFVRAYQHTHRNYSVSFDEDGDM